MTSHVPLVSVCVANYNGMEVIDDCLQSVLRQQGEIPLEILVHDDASTDDSVAYIREHYPRARLMESQSNVGFCVANNRMVAAARGKYLLLLNNDAALYPDALVTLLAEAIRLDCPAILGLPQYDAATGELIDIGSLFDPFLNPIPNRDQANNEVGMIIGACLWVPKTLWAELGGFPEWFNSLAEDMYLCVRARLAGHAVRALGESGFRHVVGHSLGGGKVTRDKRLVTSVRRRSLSERNKSFVMVLTYPAALLAPLFPLHLALLVLEGAILAFVKWDWALFTGIYLGCVYSLWREREKLFRLRQSIQAGRKVSVWRFWSVFQMTPWKLQMLLRHGLPHLK